VRLHQRIPSELKGLLEHAAWCLTELEELQKQLKKLTNQMTVDVTNSNEQQGAYSQKPS